jgi:hypothetical protein
LIIYVATTAAASMLIVWLMINLITKNFAGSPSANGLRTLYLGFTIIFVAGLPLILSYLLNGPLVTWTLPDYLTSYLAMLALIQILVVSAFSLPLSLMTALITKQNQQNIDQKSGAKMIHTRGPWFKDDFGRTVMLRGVNLGGSTKFPTRPDGATWNPEGFFEHRDVSFVDRPFPLSEADEHYSRLRQWGFNCLRFLITWRPSNTQVPASMMKSTLIISTW